MPRCTTARLGSRWGFGFQIFFDFAGYSDIAIGIGLLFGIQLPYNFNAPFRATSILTFWQRWHMTLSRFLRDYLFMPLADMRIAGTRHTVTQYVVAILLTMALCGLWHGAGWNFVLWGTMHGVAIVFALGWRRVLPSPPMILGWATTIGFFLVSGVVFRTASLGVAWNIYSGLGHASRCQDAEQGLDRRSGSAACDRLTRDAGVMSSVSICVPLRGFPLCLA